MSKAKSTTMTTDTLPGESQRTLQAALEYQRVKASGGKITFPRVAAEYNVSVRYVKTMASLLKTELAETIQAIADGKISIYKAATSGKAKDTVGSLGGDWERDARRLQGLLTSIEKHYAKCRASLADSGHVNVHEGQKFLREMAARLAKVGK